MSFFITGTDTGIGKTYVTRLLLQSLRAEGIDAVGYKPVETGGRDDARALAEISGLELEAVNPEWRASAMAPYVAGLLENRPVEKEPLIEGFRALAAAHECVVVEGAGGWEVPIAPGYAVGDLAKDLGLPVIVVVGNKLGCLNHAILTVRSIQARGLTCAGVIVNNLADELDTVAITNKGVIEDLTGVPLLTDVIHSQDFLDAWPFLELMGR